MLAVRLTAPYTLIDKGVPKPQLKKDDDVLFEVLQTGICGSDVLAYHGKHKYISYPLVLGHECVGRVLEVGSKVENVMPGNLITIQPQIVCGECYACRHDYINVCEKKVFMGINTDGFFTEYYVCSEFNTVKLPENFTSDKGMLVEPFAVGANAAEKADPVPGKRIVVLGAGTIGNCTAQILKAQGAEVLITDIQEVKLEYAKSCGIHHCVNTRNVPLRQAIGESFGGRGADAIVDCCAVASYFDEVIESASNASRVVLVGTYEANVNFDVTRVQRREIHLFSVMQYVRRHYLTAIELLGNGSIHLDDFICARYKLAELKKGFQYFDANPGTMKIAVEMK